MANRHFNGWFYRIKILLKGVKTFKTKLENISKGDNE